MENYYLGQRSPITLALPLGRSVGHLGSNSEEEVVPYQLVLKGLGGGAQAPGSHKMSGLKPMKLNCCSKLNVPQAAS